MGVDDSEKKSFEDLFKVGARNAGEVVVDGSGIKPVVKTEEKGRETKSKKKKKGVKSREQDVYRQLVEEDEKVGKSAKVEKKEEGKGIIPAYLDLVKELQAVQQTIKIEDEIVEEKNNKGDHEVPVNQLVEEKEKINERVRVANHRYQKARLHYLGHRFNLIHPDETGLLVAEDNDDFNVGRLRLVEDLLRVTKGEGDLREVKDSLIAVGVYVKDLENLSETIKPMFQKREELLQKFYDEGLKEGLESLEKEIGEVFGVEIMYERIKNGERAQPKKEVVKTEKEKGFWNQKMYKKLVVGGFTPTTESGKAALKSLNEVGIDLLEVIKNGKDIAKLADAAYTAFTQKTYEKNQFQTVEEAENFIKEYFSYLKIPDEVLNEAEQSTKEPQYYDELYLDLWNSEYGDGDEKIKSQERLISNNILPVEFGTDDVAKETYRMALEAIRNNKFMSWHNKREMAEDHIKKVHRIKESDGGEKKKGAEVKEDQERDEEREKYLEYLGGEFLEDLRVAYPEMDGNKPKGMEWSEVDEAAKKLKNKGFGEFITTKDNRDRRDFRSGRRFRERLNNYLEGKPVDEEKAFFDQVKVMKIEVIDLEEARKRGLKKDNGQLKRDGKKEDGGAGGKGSGKIDRANFDFNGKTLEQLIDMAPYSTDPKFYIAARVIKGETDPRFINTEEAKKYFLDTIESKKEKEFVLTSEIRQKLKDWVDITRKLGRPNLPNPAENLRELTELGFEIDRADLENVRQALYSISFNNGDVEGAKKYLSTLFVGGAGGDGDPDNLDEANGKVKEDEEINEEEKWNKVSDLLANLETASGDERIALYLEIEQCGVRIRGTVSDLIEAGAGEEEVKKSFRHMVNMVKVWKMGEAKAKREYPKMVEKYASMARLLRLKWYN